MALQTKDNRVRDNQRRSRARQKDHLAKQEAKLQELQTHGVKPDHGALAPMAEELIKENRHLKELVRLANLREEEIEAARAQEHQPQKPSAQNQSSPLNASQNT